MNVALYIAMKHLLDTWLSLQEKKFVWGLRPDLALFNVGIDQCQPFYIF